MKKTFLLAALLCSFFPEIGASGIPVTDESTIVQQNRKVEGIIVDEAGEPVIGVNVRVKGNSTLGTITDYDGKFSIDVSSKDILVFSYIGYKTQEVKVGDQKSLRIKMKEDSETLGEVVVTAFGTGQKKESIVGSIQTVRPNDLKVPSANLSNSFAGRLSGVIAYQRSGQPGSNIEVVYFGYRNAEGISFIRAIFFEHRQQPALAFKYFQLKVFNSFTVFGSRNFIGNERFVTAVLQ